MCKQIFLLWFSLTHSSGIKYHASHCASRLQVNLQAWPGNQSSLCQEKFQSLYLHTTWKNTVQTKVSPLQVSPTTRCIDYFQISPFPETNSQEITLEKLSEGIWYTQVLSGEGATQETCCRSKLPAMIALNPRYATKCRKKRSCMKFVEIGVFGMSMSKIKTKLNLSKLKLCSTAK